VNQTLTYLQSFGTIILVLFGIGGLSYHCFKDDGWVESALGNLWSATFQYPLIAVPVIIAAIFLGKMWNESRLTQGSTSKLPDLVIYAFMIAGVVFIGRWILYGTL
jgi:hypothetical protein